MHGTTRCTMHAISCTVHAIVIRAYGRGAWDPGPAVRSWTGRPDSSREEREPDRERPARRPRGAGCRSSPSPTSTGCAGGSTGCGRPATRRPASASASASPPTSPPPRSASPAAGPPSRWSATPRSCRSAPRRDDIAAALRDAQVVVVAGETGSGKTTQLPKIALELGRGVRGRIGHTQPRRIAARSVAERIAEELDTPLGEVVGFKMRFTDHVGDSHAGQADDRRRPARRDRARPAAAPVRHDHPRRGPRAEPQHRLPAGLPRPAAAAPSRPEAGHHLGDDRRRAGGRALRGRAGRRGQRPHLPGRGPLPPGRRPGRRGRRSRPRPGHARSSTPSTSWSPRGRATSWCSSPASGRSATPRTRWPSGRCRTPRSCRSTRGCRPPTSTRSSPRTPDGGSCWPPTSPRRR